MNTCYALAVVLFVMEGSVGTTVAGSPDIHGLVCVTSQPIPAPATTTPIPLPGGDFETVGRKRSGWDIAGTLVTAPDAPQGKAYCRFKTPRGGLHTPPDMPAPAGRPYLVSFWLKSAVETRATFMFTSDERNPSFFPTPLNVPGTGSQWKHVGCYCWMPSVCKTIRFNLISVQDSSDNEPVCVDDVQMRTATEAEMAAAYVAERAQWPPRDTSPRPDDGQNLALSIAKWEGRAGIPGKPFVIWSIGSSWTHAQGDGYGLMLAIRQRFPQAPDIIYKRHHGSGTPWEFDMGWVRQFVAADQPDLIFTYTPGTLEGLDALLTEIRRHTTADIIIPTIHFNPNAAGWYDRGPRIADVVVPRKGFDPDKAPTPAEIEQGCVFADQVRVICRKHHAELVENRRELAEYHVRTGVKPTDFLGDLVHQNLHGQMMVWESISRHLAKPAHFTYDPAALERRVAVVPPASTATEQVVVSGGWTTSGKAIRTSAAGALLNVRFIGNRIDLFGRKSPQGGSVKVFIDGQPAQQAPVFYMTFIDPDPKTLPLGGKNGAGNTAPHAVDLGANVVPQSWTITMTSDHGDYRIDGSITGSDGEGNVARQFHSKSGQIDIDPKLWRGLRKDDKGRVVCGNRAGDKFTFDVYRCARGEVRFQAEKPAAFSEAVVQNLPNRAHTLKIVTAGDGEVIIDGLYVFQPPESRPE